jgi:hypothetical protein
MRRLVAATVLVLAGCGLGDESASIEQSRLEGLVLQPGDLLVKAVRFDGGRQLAADSPGGRRADPRRFGRVDGWKARYRRPGAITDAGPLVIESTADLFDSADGAEQELEAARADLEERKRDWKPIGEPGLGDESFAATYAAGGLRFYEVLWRLDNATGALAMNGFEGKVALEQVLALARKQEERMDEAST